MMQPLVSAIVSTYNSEKFFEGKILDLLSQSIIDKLEIVIVNSGSQQNEDEMIKKYLHHSNIKYIRTEERETIYKAWNRGIKLATGKYITNANTDDRLRSDCFEMLAKVLDENPEYCMVYADQYITHEPNEPFLLDNHKVIKAKDYSFLRMLDLPLILSQPMWRASLHTEHNLWFKEEFKICGDHEFELQAAKVAPLYHLNEVLGSFYYATDKTNASFNLELFNSERLAATKYHIIDYVNELDEQDLDGLLRKIQHYIASPIPVFFLTKNIIRKFNNNLFEKRFYFTFEFAYYVGALIFYRKQKMSKARRILKKFLRYSKSQRTIDLYRQLLATKA